MHHRDTSTTIGSSSGLSSGVVIHTTQMSKHCTPANLDNTPGTLDTLASSSRCQQSHICDTSTSHSPSSQHHPLHQHEDDRYPHSSELPITPSSTTPVPLCASSSASQAPSLSAGFALSHAPSSQADCVTGYGRPASVTAASPTKASNASTLADLSGHVLSSSLSTSTHSSPLLETPDPHPSLEIDIDVRSPPTGYANASHALPVPFVQGDVRHTTASQTIAR